MKEGIHFYGILWLFAFVIIVVSQLIGLASTYKYTNESSSLLVEIIEVYDGMNQSCTKEINEIKEKYDSVNIIINKDTINDKYIYTIDAIKEFKIPLLNLAFDIKSQKITKGVKQ